MKTIRHTAWLGFAACIAATALATGKPVAAINKVPATTHPGMSAAECEVWNRERSFAASVSDHDAAAFAEHVQADAAFDAGSPTPTHGREAVVADWKDIIAGTTIKLGWSPGIVTIGGDGNLAISRGPTWIDDPRPEAKSRYRIGEFISTWIRDKDGQWRVLFDGGAAPMRQATAQDVAKLVASLPRQCPRG